jgi:L-cysteine desulfidase
MMDQSWLKEKLQSELQKTMGCTDPGAVALAAARAAATLAEEFRNTCITVSPGIYKNGISIMVPGTGRRGLRAAAALGAILAEHADQGLNILEYAGEGEVRDALRMVDLGLVEVTFDPHAPDAIYIRVEITGISHTAWSVIQADYSNLVETGRDGRVVFKARALSRSGLPALVDYPMAEIFDTIKHIPMRDLRFLEEASEINRSAALRGLEDDSIKLGREFASYDGNAPFPESAMRQARLYTAAAAEARMAGLRVPVMALAGSGNHGITALLGVLAVAETMHSSAEDRLRAMAIACGVTIYIKEHMQRVSALCGCAVAAAVGLAAGTAHLLGGTYEDLVNAIQSTIEILAGMICDGAKESCAYKLSSSSAIAIEQAYLSTKKKVFISPSSGIISHSIEDTIAKLGLLNHAGMMEMEKTVVEIIRDIQEHSSPIGGEGDPGQGQKNSDRGR